MSDTVQQIKERLSIVDVVTPYVKLTRAGRYWKGLSPFTKEKTASFFVSPDRGLYHCFSTGKGGDMFTFIEEMEGVDFRGALKILADKAGVEIVAEAPGAKDEREQIFAALAAAQQWFEEVRGARKDVDLYLEKRGVDDQTRRHWHIGYAPKEWHALKEALTKKGFADVTLEKAGLIKRPDAGEQGTPRFYDRFRGRIMFPLFDPSARVIGFSGRIFEDDPAHPGAKYLNSPDSNVFDKSRALYGIHIAKNAIREMNFSMLVEGQVDLIMAHKAGFRNAVATSGTAFTAGHADMLKRYSTNILIAYDGDKAGIAAAGRAAAVLLPKGMNVKIAKLPAGKDPADVIHEDVAVFRQAVKNATHIVDFYLALLKEDAKDDRAYKLSVSQIVLPLIALIDNKIDQDHFVGRVAEALGVSTDAVRAELNKLGKPAPVSVVVPAPQSREDDHEHMLFGIWHTLNDSGDPRAERMQKVFDARYGATRRAELSALPPHELEAAKMRADDEFFSRYPDAATQEVFLLDQEKIQHGRTKDDEKKKLAKLIAEAEKRGDSATVAELSKELNDLAKESKN